MIEQYTEELNRQKKVYTRFKKNCTGNNFHLHPDLPFEKICKLQLTNKPRIVVFYIHHKICEKASREFSEIPSFQNFKL